MAIGTAQPSAEELAAVPHYFIAQFAPDEDVSAGLFERCALEYLESIFASSDTAIVCGGTGLYIRALCGGLDDMPPVDNHIALAVADAYKSGGREWLQAALGAEDPQFLQSGDAQNPARMLRALAFVRSTGKSISAFRSGAKKERPFRIVKAALEIPREVLYARISNRVDAMMRAGLTDEVAALLPYRHCKALQTVGYAEIFDYLDGCCSLAVAIEKIKQHTRNYAKRQLTWLRREENLQWLRYDDAELMDQLVALSRF